MDVSPATIFKNPQLYRACIENEFFKVNYISSIYFYLNLCLYL